MRYKTQPYQVDIGETPIENIFLNQYLQLADGNSLKVYLYAIKNAKDPNVNYDITDEKIAMELGLTVTEVKESWKFWLNEGIVTKEYDEETGEEILFFLSIREIVLGKIDRAEYNPEEERKMPENSNEISKMFDKIESVLSMELTPNELERILNHISDYGQEPDLIAEAFVFSGEKYGKQNINYVLGILRNWNMDGIKSMEDLKKARNEVKNRKKNIKLKRNYYKPNSNINKGTNIKQSTNKKEENNIDDFILQRFMDKKDDGNNQGEI